MNDIVLRLLLSLLLLVSAADARQTSGNFVLSGVNSEQTLGSFALSPQARGWFDIMMSSKEMYANERNLKLHFFLDTNWSKFKKATTCDEKIKLAKETHNINFEYVSGTKEWKSNVAVPLAQPNEMRAHYWYFVITDCSLEYQYRDGTIPNLEYTIQAWNDISGPAKTEALKDGNKIQNVKSEMSHFGADETGIVTAHYVTFILSGLICLLMFFLIFNRMVETKSVHFALFLVMTAAACDSSSSFCEIIHLRWYERNGYGWYLFDALSSHFEAMCDAMLTMLLLAIASGWTMPSDVVQVASVQTTFVQSLQAGLRNPIGALFSFNKAAILFIFVIGAHMVLAQWGRVYNDDFDSYHDLEHLPGKILMGIRIFVGLIMVAVAMQSKAGSPPSVAKFYTKLAFVGTLWFQGLPFVTWVCTWAVPYYLRHPTVTLYGGLCQTGSLVMLAWLVTAHSKSGFHKLSRMQQKDDMTDSLSGSLSNSSAPAAVTSFSIGKAKVRLD